MKRNFQNHAGSVFRLGGALTGLLIAAALVFAGCSNPTSGGSGDPSTLGDARLASLVVEPGNLSPAFCPDATEYVMNVANDLEDISIEGTPREAGATVSGRGTHPIAVGTNPFNVKVTTAGGLEKIYSITVNRADPYASKNAALQSLSIDPGMLDRPFESKTMHYQVALPNRVDSIVISAPAQDEKATVSGAGTQALEVGLNNLRITVTAPAGNYSTYTLEVRRAGPETGGSDDAGLASLKLQTETGDISLDVTDLNGVYEYNAPVETGAVSLEILANSDSATTTFTVDPPEAWSGGEIFLGADETVVTITVTAGDGVTVKPYVITINRPEKSADASLAGLVLEGADLNPPFSPEIYAYTVVVANSYSQPSISAPPKHRLANVVIDAPEVLSTDGVNRATITVTAETGGTAVYTIDITRPKDTDAYLMGIEASAGSLTEPFSANTLEYTLDVPNSVDSVTITAAPSSAVASVDGAPAGESKSYTVNLTPGVGVDTTITVTAESGATRAYKVTAVRRSSGNNKLKSLGFTNGVLEPDFDPDTASYRATVTTATGVASFSVDVTAETDDDAATVAEGTGTKALNLGANLIPVKVRAANGLEKTYTILIIREEGYHISGSLAEMMTFLGAQEGTGTPAAPYGVTLNNQSGTTFGVVANITQMRQGQPWQITDSTNICSTQGTIYLYQDFGNKYVALDMSGSSGLQRIYHTIQGEADSSSANRMLLVSVVLPAALTEIGEHAFSYCVNLKSVTLNYEGVVDLKQRTQDSNFPAVGANPILPENLNAVGSTQFANVPSNCVFYVPAGQVENYRNSLVWSYINDSQFQPIVED
jgi:hypothetical protein